MKQYLIIPLLLLSSAALFAQDITWKRTWMDGSRTGCSAPGVENVSECLGTVKGSTYYAPNGRVLKGGSVALVAKTLIDVQPVMADVKTHVAVCPAGMNRQELYNFSADMLLEASERLFGRKADMAILNSGGIRTDMPKGEIIKDDMLSMFPFHNRLVLVELPGTAFKAMFERVFARRPQPFAGVQLFYKDRKLQKVLVGGEQIDPAKTYYLTTVDFLLGGGDRMMLGTGSTDIKYTDIDVIDIVLEYMLAEDAAGRPIVGREDDRLVFSL